MYVLAPMGKIVPFSGDQMNELMKDHGSGYARLDDWSAKKENIKCLVTSRPRDYLVHHNFDPPTLTMHFGQVMAELEKLPGVDRTEFDPLDEIDVRVQASLVGNERALREYELPHKNFRECLKKRLETSFARSQASGA
jgi:hypothetical protein